MVDRLIKPPEELAVSIAAARLAARVDGTDLDGEIETAIQSITDDVEHLTGRAIVFQTWRVTLDHFPAKVKLPAPPVSRVLRIKYFDPAGVEQTMDPDDYLVDAVSEPGYVMPAPGRAWPATLARINAVNVEVKCGYGEDDTSTPSGIKGYILAKVQEKFAPAGTPESPHLIRGLDRYKVY